MERSYLSDFNLLFLVEVRSTPTKRVKRFGSKSGGFDSSRVHQTLVLEVHWGGLC